MPTTRPTTRDILRTNVNRRIEELQLRGHSTTDIATQAFGDRFDVRVRSNRARRQLGRVMGHEKWYDNCFRQLDDLAAALDMTVSELLRHEPTDG